MLHVIIKLPFFLCQEISQISSTPFCRSHMALRRNPLFSIFSFQGERIPGDSLFHHAWLLLQYCWVRHRFQILYSLFLLRCEIHRPYPPRTDLIKSILSRYSGWMLRYSFYRYSANLYMWYRNELWIPMLTHTISLNGMTAYAVISDNILRSLLNPEMFRCWIPWFPLEVPVFFLKNQQWYLPVEMLDQKFHGILTL